MRVRLSDEAGVELEQIRSLDPIVAAAVEESIEFLRLEADEFEGDSGFSIEQLVSLKKTRAVDAFRLKNEEQMPGLRVLFFRGRKGIFVTGVHDRGVLYDTLREPMTRVVRYWGMRRNL